MRRGYYYYYYLYGPIRTLKSMSRHWKVYVLYDEVFFISDKQIFYVMKFLNA